MRPPTNSAGTLYFASGPPQPGKHFDICSAAREGDGFAPREPLGPTINTEPTGTPGEGLQDAWEFNPEISVNGHILIFTSLRPGGFGLGDLYVSQMRSGEWTPARNLGPAVNSEYDEYHPTLSRDGRELFFVRRIFRPDPFLRTRRLLPHRHQGAGPALTGGGRQRNGLRGDPLVTLALGERRPRAGTTAPVALVAVLGKLAAIALPDPRGAELWPDYLRAMERG